MMNKNRCTEFKKTNSIVYTIQRDLFFILTTIFRSMKVIDEFDNSALHLECLKGFLHNPRTLL